MLFDLEDLVEAYFSCRKRKRRTQNALKFELNWEKELITLQKELTNRTYYPGRSICFVVTYPKAREVFAADFRDRVVHHVLVDKLEPYFEKRFIYNSFACRKNKGAHFAIERLKKALNQVTCNKTAPAYYLQVDVKSFFCTLDKRILYRIIQDVLYQDSGFVKTKEELLWLVRTIIYHDPTKHFYFKGERDFLNALPADKTLFKAGADKGLPIGNLTSQFFANIYLDKLDQFAKRELKAKYYFRYVDDILILSEDYNQLLEWRERIGSFLKKELNVELNHKKDKLGSVWQGIDFVGYFVNPEYTLSRTRVVKNLKTKLHYFNSGYLLVPNSRKQQMLPLRVPISRKELVKMVSTINSYYGHFRHADTYNLRKHLYTNHFGILKEYLSPTNSFSSFTINEQYQ
ncbi:MAG: reverse transcriptase domain-containing protein [Patescibacteria group bacterium]|jgi:RNA-directed DNA polymerase